MDTANVWVAVLAAGDGKRVQSYTLDHEGSSMPKQYWRFDGRRSLLQATLARARKLAPLTRIVPVVAVQHRRWWENELRTLRADNIMVQPKNAGTAAGILLPQLHIVRRDPEAHVLVLPSDHAVRQERVLESALQGALSALEEAPDCVLLLGITPDSADPEYGWILPGQQAAGAAGRGVTAFVEKPSPAAARSLLAGGALWNSFMFAASARALLRLYADNEPELLGMFLEELAETPEAAAATLRAFYELLPVRDFSRDLLQKSTGRLRVLPMPACGWIDVGTPARLRAWRRTARVPQAPVQIETRRALSA